MKRAVRQSSDISGERPVKYWETELAELAESDFTFYKTSEHSWEQLFQLLT